MWVLLGGVVASIFTVLLRVVDLIIEGRGSWARRSIRADLELLAALPDDVKAAAGGEALQRRIEQSLITYGISEPETSVSPTVPGTHQEVSERIQDLRERSAARAAENEFRREASRLEALISLSVSLVLVAATSFGFWASARDGSSGLNKMDSTNDWLVVFATAAALAIPMTFGLMAASRRIAIRVVRRRWTNASRTIPARYRK